eukprot:Skav223045  [mRNA]  locus=scaffold1069:239761:244235:+ [translate_table: standard]
MRVKIVSVAFYVMDRTPMRMAKDTEDLCTLAETQAVADLAIDSGHAGTVRALLEGKANLTADSLHVVEVLLSARAKVDTQGNWAVSESPQGETALHLASNYDTAMSLFRAQANPDISDHQGAKAFYRCAENGYETVTRAFFDAGLLEQLDRI